MIPQLALLVALGIPHALVGAQSIDPNDVPKGTRINWCTSQMSSCPILCSQTSQESVEPLQNDCDEDTLVYHCVCADGLTPNATEYSETIPYFLCTEANNQCVAQCQGSSSCQSNCRENHPCGAKNPTRVNTSTISTMSATGTASSAGGADVIYTGFGSSTPTSASGSGGTNAARTAADVGSSYGLGVVAAGIFAGFALLL